MKESYNANIDGLDILDQLFPTKEQEEKENREFYILTHVFENDQSFSLATKLSAGNDISLEEFRSVFGDVDPAEVLEHLMFEEEEAQRDYERKLLHNQINSQRPKKAPGNKKLLQKKQKEKELLYYSLFVDAEETPESQDTSSTPVDYVEDSTFNQLALALKSAGIK